VLRFRLCSQEVLEAILRIDPSLRKKERTSRTGTPALPAHLFSKIKQRPNFGRTGAPVWKDRDYPIPFLRYLFSLEAGLTPLDVNAHGGYALTKAVHTGFRALIQFLLYHGADPSIKGNLAVLVAIRQKDLSLVKMLIERIDLMVDNEQGDDTTSRLKSKGKKRKLPDRISVAPEMLKVAVQCDARDIVDYLIEKGCIPDIATLNMLERT
jgi:ankyrin repeat protein